VSEWLGKLTGQQVATRELADFGPRAPLKAPPKLPKDFYVAGLDLGQAADYTALAINHVTHAPDPQREGKHVRHHAIRHLERWPLGTSYVDIARDTGALLAQLPGVALAADKTGVGSAVVDVFRAHKLRARLVPILITSGNQTTRDGNEWHVPKKELVSALQSALQQRRFQVAPLRLAAVLRKEMETFRVKVSAATGNESFEAWRERDHDDLVLAVALAVFLAEQGRRKFCFFA
jgi:hypothetical protein